jgi:hypothetical protein
MLIVLVLILLLVIYLMRSTSSSSFTIVESENCQQQFPKGHMPMGPITESEKMELLNRYIT